MAKKKAKSTKKKSSGGRSGKQSFDLAKLGGMAGAVFGNDKLDEMEFMTSLDPKLAAVGKIVIGEYAPKQDFLRKMVKNDSLLRGAGDGLAVLGIKDLMTEMGLIQGVGNTQDDDDLVVVIEGIDDLDIVNEDILGEDEDMDVVNEDILGDDDDEDEDIV